MMNSAQHENTYAFHPHIETGMPNAGYVSIQNTNAMKFVTAKVLQWNTYLQDRITGRIPNHCQLSHATP